MKDRSQMWRVDRRGGGLYGPQVRDSRHADPAVGPVAESDPFNRVVSVLGLGNTVIMRSPRLVPAPNVLNHDHVTPPDERFVVELLLSVVLVVARAYQNHRKPALDRLSSPRRTIHVGNELHAVPHFDGNVPLDEDIELFFIGGERLGGDRVSLRHGDHEFGSLLLNQAVGVNAGRVVACAAPRVPGFCMRSTPGLLFSPRGEAKCLRGPSGRGASRAEEKGARNMAFKVFHESRVTEHESRPFLACFDRRVVRNAGYPDRSNWGTSICSPFLSDDSCATMPGTVMARDS